MKELDAGHLLDLACIYCGESGHADCSKPLPAGRKYCISCGNIVIMALNARYDCVFYVSVVSEQPNKPREILAPLLGIVVRAPRVVGVVSDVGSQGTLHGTVPRSKAD